MTEKELELYFKDNLSFYDNLSRNRIKKFTFL